MTASVDVRTPVVRAPFFPTYTDLGHAIRLLDGEPIRRVLDMIRAIWDQTGTPQSPVDWSDPDKWMEERLGGDLRDTARKIWVGSGKTLNPRYVDGCYRFINRLALLEQNGGIYRLGERGRRFLAGDEAILRELDAAEGLPKLLSLVAERSPCKRGDILAAWSDYLKAVSSFTAASSVADALWQRLRNLAERSLILRERNRYVIADAGIQWLKGFASSKRTTVAEAARAHNEEQFAQLRARLMALEPVQFEHFVRELLDAMDYEDVRVTRLSGDKGVDVVARVQFGITEITEVVQVKRTEATITRPTIDALRGALPYHKAIRGTIISLGRFAKGAQEGALFVGAAPITLIDGRRLLELCIEHEVGVKCRPVEIYEVDEAFFAQKFAPSEEENSRLLLDDANGK